MSLFDVKVLTVKTVSERRERRADYYPLRIFKIELEFTYYMNADDPLLDCAEFVYKRSNNEFYQQIRAWAEKAGFLGLNVDVYEDNVAYFSLLSPDLWTKREVRRWLRDLLNDLEHDAVEGIG